MVNSEPIFFDKPAQYPTHIVKRNSHGDEEMMFITDKSKNKVSTGEPEMCISLNKNSFNTIFLFTHGECNLHIGLNNYVLKPNDLVVIPEHVPNYSSSMIENWGYGIHFKTEYLLPFLKISSIGDILPHMVNDTKYVLALTSCQRKFIKVLFEEIYHEYDSSSKEKDEIIRCYLEILCLKCKEYFREGLPTVHSQTNRSFALTRQFKSLVEKNFINIRIVGDYADILHISPKHLEKTVKETLGITPKNLIHDMVLINAKFLLKQTEKTISEIAYDLKFEDPSYFSRFFKRHILITPQDYRTQ
jgi:AraC family transcriptional regulator, transcriptional activator of pobA